MQLWFRVEPVTIFLLFSVLSISVYLTWSLDFIGPHDLLWPINEAEGMGYNAWLRVWETLDFLWAAYTSALFRRRVHLD